MPAANTSTPPRIFRSRLLQRLSYTHPALVIGLYVPVSLLSLGYAILVLQQTWYVSVGTFAIALLAWTLTEYTVHRYGFHFQAKTALGKRLVQLAHGYHHEYPKDKDHLFMPIPASLVLAAVFFGVFYLLMGHYAFSFFPGFLLGYLAYSLVHYSIHAIPQPPKAFRAIWRHHLQHHYKYPNRAFGVSNLFWDRVFGTLPPKRKQLVR